MLLSQVAFLRCAASQAKTRRVSRERVIHKEGQQREGDSQVHKAKERRWGDKSPKSTSRKARGSGVYGIKTKDAG